MAATLEWLACEDEASEACERHGLARLQLAVAAAGFIPALLLAGALLTRSRRLGIAALIGAIALYATWAVLADAAVHGGTI